MAADADRKSLVGSGGFEKKGGYPSPKTPVAKLPKVPAGPAPGAARPATAPASGSAGT